MIWAVGLACAVSAWGHLMFVVPRLGAPAVEDGEQPPDYRALATPAAGALVATAALAAALLALRTVPASHLPMWFGYLGAGAALVYVDLRTTYLPRTLNHICLAQVLLGLIPIGLAGWQGAVGGLLGGLAAFAMFHVVWAIGSGFGYGDVRLAGIVGVVAGTGGVQSWVTAVLLATLIGAVWAIVHWAATRRHGTASPFPYGPALWLGPITAMALAG